MMCRRRGRKTSRRLSFPAPEKLRDDFFNAAKLLIALTFAAKSLFGLDNP
jgi:hypothetical protein